MKTRFSVIIPTYNRKRLVCAIIESIACSKRLFRLYVGMTRFSVIIPTYNRKRLVLQAIDSIMAQTFKDYEVFIIDDGSTDGTQDALRGYLDRIHFLQQSNLDRIHFLQQSNQGPEVARNLGARKANGEYLALLDSDDSLM